MESMVSKKILVDWEDSELEEWEETACDDDCEDTDPEETVCDEEWDEDCEDVDPDETDCEETDPEEPDCHEDGVAVGRFETQSQK